MVRTVIKLIENIILAGAAFLGLGVVGFVVAAGSAAVEVWKEGSRNDKRSGKDEAERN